MQILFYFPSAPYAENDDEYKYIGITHASNTQGLDNVRLKFNPNVNDTRPSHLRPFSTHDKKKNFKRKKLKGYRIHKADKKTVRKVKKNYRA